MSPTKNALNPQDTQAYLAHIGYTGSTDPSLQTLTALQRRHMQAVPFENLDVFVGRPLDLSPQALFDKVVRKRRGGYCFELNTLYAELLRSLGFAPIPVLARVRLHNPAQSTPRTHLTHLVEVAGTVYLTDVGFGGMTSRIPLPIEGRGAVDDGEGRVRVTDHQAGEYLLEREKDGGWIQQYSFEIREAIPADIRVNNHFTETHPDSHFVGERFVGRFTEKGRIGLHENQFIERIGQQVVKTQEISDGDWADFVAERFDLIPDYTGAELAKLGRKF